MTKTYQTETGFYILKDSNGDIITKANANVGEHDVTDKADRNKSFDVQDVQELQSYSVSPNTFPTCRLLLKRVLSNIGKK